MTITCSQTSVDTQVMTKQPQL